MSVTPIIETLHGPATGFVYFIVIGDPWPDYVKIGYTAKNPRARMAALQTGNHQRLHLLGFVPGCVNMERELHDVLRDDRLEGEWFRFSDYVMRVIDSELEAEAA